MASSVGCWTSSSKVGRSGFSLSLIIKLCEDVQRLTRLYTFTSCRFLWTVHSPAFCILPLFSYDHIYRCISTRFRGFLGFFIWCIYVRECAVRSTLHDVFHQLLNSCSYPGQSTVPIAYVALLLSLQLSPSLQFSVVDVQP